MAKKRNGGSKRQIDESISKANKRLKSKFVLVPSMKIKTWKALVVIMFVTGFVAALVWGACNKWYLQSSASTVSENWNQACEAGGLKCPQKSCIPAGKVSRNGSLGPRGNFGTCCSGLKEIDNGLVYNAKTQSCLPVVGAGVICSNCGNGKCEKWENPCSCPKDCH